MSSSARHSRNPTLKELNAPGFHDFVSHNAATSKLSAKPPITISTGATMKVMLSWQG
jgi:hypothetical protein